MSKPSTSETSQTDWERIDAMQDEEIDLSEIPEATEEQMGRAVLRVGGIPVARGKRRVNMFLDAFIVEFFKAKAGERGYQTLINEALVDYIRNHEIEDTVRRVIREELQRAIQKGAETGLEIMTPEPEKARRVLQDAITRHKHLLAQSVARTQERVQQLADQLQVDPALLLAGEVPHVEEHDMDLLELEGELEMLHHLCEQATTLEHLSVCL